MVANSQLVIFAIQAGVRLYAVGRKAYVEATLDRPLILPLPRGPNISSASAHMFFKNDPKGKEITKIEENERIRIRSFSSIFVISLPFGSFLKNMCADAELIFGPLGNGSISGRSSVAST